MKTKLLQLSQIVTTAGTQIRASINHDSVDEYASAMTDGAKFPAVVVFHDGSEYILADGFHRVMAASRNGFKDIEAEIHKGTKSDALKYALGANSTHGLKRTNADKRRSVELALSEWPKLSSREIAMICAVHKSTVDEARNQLAESASSSPQTRIGRDGKERKMPERKQAPVFSEPDPEPDDEPTPSPAPTPSAQFESAIGIGIGGAVNFFASQIEDICEAVVQDGSPEQLEAVIAALKTQHRKLSAALPPCPAPKRK